MVAFLLTNALLLALLGWWLRRAYRLAPSELQPWLLPALGWRLVVTVAAAYWPSMDAQHASAQGQNIAARLMAHPVAALAQLQQSYFYYRPTGPGEPVYRWSQTLFFDKLIALLNLLSGGSLWLNAFYFSMGCFVGCWSLVAVLRRVLPQAPLPAALLAFLLWPTVLWWSAGLNKETVLIGTGTGLLALALPLLYRQVAQPWPSWLSLAGRLLALGVLAWVMTRVRYFFTLPLLGGLLALAAMQATIRQGWLGRGWVAQAGGLLLGLVLLLGLAKALGGEQMTEAYFVREVNLNYHHGLVTSGGRPSIAYASWEPTVAGLLALSPLAVVETLVRPWPGESPVPLYVGAGLENALLALLVGWALWGVVRGRPGPLPAGLVLVLVLYCLLLAAFTGLSTPNLGTLNRYRSVLLPWLLWLVLSSVMTRDRAAGSSAES